MILGAILGNDNAIVDVYGIPTLLVDSLTALKTDVGGITAHNTKLLKSGRIDSVGRILRPLLDAL